MIRPILTLTALTLAAPALADGHMPTLYTYPATANYCPAGLQPVVLGGVICCGQPTTHATWTDAMRHAGGARHTPRYDPDPYAKGK